MDDRDDSKVHCSPVFTSIEVLDPAPPEPPNADTDDEDLAKSPPAGSDTPNLCTAGSAQPPCEVLQRIKFHFRLFVHQHPRTATNYRLAYSSPELKGSYNVDIHVSNTGLDESRTARHWKVELYNWDGYSLDAADGGPDFTAPDLQDVKACEAKLRKSGDVAYDSQSMTPLPGQMHAIDGSGLSDGFAGSVEESTYTVVGVTLSCERRVSKKDWRVLGCKSEPAPKSALLKSANRTGDVILVGGEGVEAAAHSAVLVDVPYFEAKLREEWSGTTAWNLHNKLRLRLPCAADAKTLKLFLRCIYGDVKPLYKVEPTSLLLQEVLSLADACNIPDVCADVIRVVEVTSENVNSWLEWLLKEHGADAEPIQQQVVKVMRDQLQNALERQKLTVEQLAAMSRFLAGSDSPHVAP